MKLLKTLLVIMAAAVITLAIGGNGLAFHEEGVAYCAGCHSMHFSVDGSTPENWKPGGDFLLKYGSGTATCLSCHASYGQFAGGEGYGGGGDFYWITKDWTWEAHGRSRISKGDDHGHNVIATEYGLNEDQTLKVSPGGAFSSSNLSCASCHDPHGTGEAPLLLRNNESYFGASFPAAPVMKSPGRRTASSNAVSDTNHPAYGSGMSEWCGACHERFTGTVNMHPTSRNLSGLAINYNNYISTDQPTQGNPANSYWEIVPFETGQAEDLLDINSTEGPSSSGQVMCLSCHRSHATAFANAVRWDADTELLIHSHPNGGIPESPDPDDAGTADNSSLDDKTNSYYGQTVEVRWGANQRSLCNKCHAKDGAHSG